MSLHNSENEYCFRLVQSENEMFMKILCLRAFTREDVLKAITVIVSEALDDDTKDVSKYIVKVNDDTEGANMLSTNMYTFSRKNRTKPTQKPLYQIGTYFRKSNLSKNQNQKGEGKKVLSMIIYSKETECSPNTIF